MRWLIATVATLALAPGAYAQEKTVTATSAATSWSEPTVAITTGETVTWSWDGTHDVKSKSANWNVHGEVSPFAHRFTAPGTYTYVCRYHELQGMTGTVEVTDATATAPPPPSPPPPSEQPWPNDQPSPTMFERPDEVRPRLTAVRATAVRRGARVRFRLSEPARVTVRITLAGKPKATARRSFKAGRRSLIVRNRRLDGRYRVEAFARDLAGNRSATRRATVRVR